MYISKYQSFCIFLVLIQYISIIVCDYNSYQASLGGRNLPQTTNSFIKPYYHSNNDYENRNHEFWYENKPMPHYHGNVPIIIHQHYTQDENFIDDQSYVTDPPGFSLQKYKEENLQKLSTNKKKDSFYSITSKTQLSRARLSGSENFDGKEGTSQQSTIKNKLTKSEEKLLKEIEDEIAMDEKKKGKSSNLVVEDITDNEEDRKIGSITTDRIGTSISTIKSTEEKNSFASLPPGTQPDPLPHLPKVPSSANTYIGNEGKKETKFKSTLQNEVNIIEPDNDKNQGSDYMDDLDKMSTGNEKPTTPTMTKQTWNEKVGSDYDLIPDEKKKTIYEKENNAEFFATETHNTKTTTQLEKMKSSEKNVDNEAFFQSVTKESTKKKCCPCCNPSTLSPEISPKYEFTQYINNPQKPVPISVGQSNYPSSYIPTGAELAARYGVPYPSLVNQGKSCGSPSIPCLSIPYIPPPCCTIPQPKCCLPTIPCCPKVQISCCPQTAICCQPNFNQLQGPRTSCGACKSKTMMKYRSKRNTCLPCKYNSRSKRSNLFEMIYPELDQHHRVKRFGCIPCLNRRVKRTPSTSNCQTCLGNGNTRVKRTINCTLCKGGIASNLRRNKRDVSYDSPGYDNIFNCDKSCCDYSKCNELSAKPLQSRKKKLN